MTGIVTQDDISKLLDLVGQLRDEKRELLATLKVMLDQIDDDPRAAQFFDLRLIQTVKELIAKAEGKD